MSFLEPSCRSWSHFVGIYSQRVTSSFVNIRLKYPHEGPCVDLRGASLGARLSGGCHGPIKVLVMARVRQNGESFLRYSVISNQYARAGFRGHGRYIGTLNPHPLTTNPYPPPQRCRRGGESESSLLTTYWSGSTDVFGVPASRHGSLNPLLVEVDDEGGQPDVEGLVLAGRERV